MALTFTSTIKKLKQKGKIVYEYNPFKNLRIIPQATHYYETQNDTYVIASSGKTPTHYEHSPGDFRKPTQGVISDFDTELLNFDLEHPVEIECQPSYDGSVNLILDDGVNPTRLINSRFTVRQNNTYEIVDRTGNADTNLYDQDQFDLDTSLYKKINTIPKLNFLGIVSGGDLPVGNYNFYFKYTDADGNETDFIAESGNVVCHIGNVNDPYSIRSGLENENSGKIVQFSLTNLDSAYDYVKVYYSRQTSSAHNEPITEYKQIIKTFKTKNSVCLINITGFEETLPSTLEEINKEYFLANCAKSLAQCKNRLFLANLSKPSINYQDFQDISLRMLPYYENIDGFSMDHNYIANTDSNYGYYNVKNIYNKVGYWNEEIYRLGVVYILSDNSLSPVFNIRGCNELPLKDNVKSSYYERENGENKLFVYINDGDSVKISDERDYIKYDEETCLIEDGIANLENNKGVVRIKTDYSDNELYSIGIHIPTYVQEYLETVLKVKGMFFVRQKRIPTILTQAFIIGHDIISGIPLIPYSANSANSYLFESFTDESGLLTQDYESRLVAAQEAMCNNEVAICPDYSVRQELYNNFFTDTDFIIKKIANYNILRDDQNSRHYYADQAAWDNSAKFKINSIIGVPDGTQLKRTRDSLFSSKAGNAESYDFTTVGFDFDLDYDDPPREKQYIVRGNYGSFLGISKYSGDAGDLINIYIPNYQEIRMQEYFTIRYEDQTPYYAISERIEINKLPNELLLFRGDCYICQYTYRLNRNFQDLNAPTNDIIVDDGNWFYNYRPDSAPEKLGDINIGDLNAVQLGSWFTFTVRSNINLSIRDEDSSNISENLLTGNNRSFYPLTELSTDGNYKLPESSIVNTGISSQVSQRVNFIQPEVPYIKNCYQTRIAYSDVSVTDAFKNGYRTFQAGSYRDYPTTYGGIMKIVEVKNSLLVIFEHGIGIAPINERIMTGGGTGGNVYINTGNVLPEILNMITTDYGTQWPESVVQTPHGVYGIDTVAKKLWKYDGNQIELLSDDRVQQFLNNNITLTENELTPIVGVRNVKTHYNAFKKDVMFTFYDCLEGYEECAWNLCYNEYSGKFTTFYSWIPSYSANIDNIFFSFDRDTSKKISKLDTSNKNGICVDSSMLKTSIANNAVVYVPIQLSLKDELPDKYAIEWKIESTLFNADKYFKLITVSGNFNQSVVFSHTMDSNTYIKYDPIQGLQVTDIIETGESTIDILLSKHKVLPLNIKATVYELSEYQTSGSIPDNAVKWGEYKKQLYFTTDEYITLNKTKQVTDDEENTSTVNLTKEELNEKASEVLTTAFWKHGYGGIIDSQGKLKPCNWYGKQHPFEFEYVVNVSPDQQKTFDSMQILSNNVAPESFHYEIVGDTYDFAEDKLNMYVRQELTKHLYQLNGSDIVYNSNYKDLLSRVEQRPIYNYDKLTKTSYEISENRYQSGYSRVESYYKDKSTLFPTYYTRIDTFDEIYDDYVRATDPDISRNYSQLSGGEIKYDPLLDQFSIVNHVQAIDVKNPIYGRLRGNIQYINDKWNVQINPLNFVQKNETWNSDKIPLNIRYSNLIHDITTINPKLCPTNYNGDDIDVSDWGNRKEAKLQDKYMKVKIRYSGDKLALITGVRTTFRV